MNNCKQDFDVVSTGYMLRLSDRLDHFEMLCIYLLTGHQMSV